MRDIPTFETSSDMIQDIKSMYGINVEKEIRTLILAGGGEPNCLGCIIVTQEEYDTCVDKNIIGPNDFTTRSRWIAAKIIGIEDDTGNIKVVNTLGEYITTVKNKQEFTEHYFVEMI
jgi:hypothetical protein